MELVLSAPDTCLTVEAWGPETLTLGGQVGSLVARTQGDLVVRSTDAAKEGCSNGDGMELETDIDTAPTPPECD